MDVLEKCNLCNRNCLVNRYEKIGYCKQTNEIRIAKATLTYFEEPCISNEKGSGTIFFTGCNLKCLFCQNYDISTKNIGKTITIKRLSEIMLELQHKGAHNINLVTPTIYVPQIIKAIKLAKKNGLDIPIIYNSSGYENLETIKMLKGYIDVYLPDFKYYDNNIAIKYSSAKDYFKYASTSLQEMIKQVGSCKFDKNGMITKGVIVRHLLLPTHLEDSKKIIKYLSQYKDNIYLSIMNQYTPIRKLKYEELNHPVKKDDYYELIDYAVSLNIKNAFCQEDETVSESFIPIWNFEGVEK